MKEFKQKLMKAFQEANREGFGTKTHSDRHNMKLDIVKNFDDSDNKKFQDIADKLMTKPKDTRSKSPLQRTSTKKTISSATPSPKKGATSKSPSNKSPAKKSPKSPKKGSTQSLKRSNSTKSSKTPPKASPKSPAKSKNTVTQKPKFQEIDPKNVKSQLSAKNNSDSNSRVNEIKNESGGTLNSSSESIKSIIDEVRNELLMKPRKTNYLSDESPPILNRSCSYSDGQMNYNRKRLEHDLVEGTKHFGPKSDDDEIFTKCKSRSTSITSYEGFEKPLKGSVDNIAGSDEVFETSFPLSRNSSFHGKSNSRRGNKLDTRRTSSLEDLSKFISDNLKNQHKNKKDRHSSVSINDKPEYFEYLLSPSPTKYRNSRLPGSHANHASNFSNSSNGIALLQTTPKRGSLKKPSALPKNSDYDRGRSHNGGRDSFRQRERDRERDERDRDTERESDREQRESQRGTLNRSLSNNEGTPEDKIGEYKIIKKIFDFTPFLDFVIEMVYLIFSWHRFAFY